MTTLVRTDLQRVISNIAVKADPVEPVEIAGKVRRMIVAILDMASSSPSISAAMVFDTSLHFFGISG